VQFGKLISKAYLTGTLKNPKWRFEYLSGINKVFGGGLGNVLKNLLDN